MPGFNHLLFSYAELKRGRPTSPGMVRTLLLVHCLIMLLAYLGYELFQISWPIHVTATVVLVYVLGCSYLTSAQRASSLPFIYLLVFSAFHLGLAIPYGYGYDPDQELSRMIRFWLSSYWYDAAVWLVIYALLGFVTGVLIAGCGRAESSISDGRGTLAQPPRGDTLQRNLTIISSLFFVGGICLWLFTLVSSGGPAALFYSYGQYLTIAASQGSLLGDAYLFITLGFPMLIACRPGSLRRFGIRLFLIWAPLAFIMGLRGEVLFPLAVAIAILARQGTRIRGSLLLPLMLVALIAISAVEQVRVGGLGEADMSEISAGPLDAFVELGSTLRPVTYVIKWADEGEAPLMGSSYWAPIERIVLKVFPLSTRVSAALDDRLLNVLVMRRSGPIGFSTVAEAFRNFGAVGVAVVFIFIGWLLSTLDRLGSRPVIDIAIVAVMSPLLIHVRNSFAPVPYQVVFGLSVIVLAWLGTAIAKSRRREASFGCPQSS